MGLPAHRGRFGAGGLVVTGVLFVGYPALRPWEDESTAAGALKAMSSDAWVVSHFFAMIGFILVALGLLALWYAVARTGSERIAFGAVVATWIGAGLTLPYYGGEAFALNAIATKAEEGERLDLLVLADAFRTQPVGVTAFGVGLVLLGLGAVLAAVAIWRSGTLPRYGGILFAVGFVLFLPQFYTPAPVRIGHGVLTGVGLAWLGVVLWQAMGRVDAAASAAGEEA
jgi:hypothetical protein